MKLRQLEYFVAVAEERHFGRAAERLRVAQPGISQQIKILERSLGTELFIRGSDGVQLTESGEALLDHARLVLELAERTQEIPRLVARGKAGLLKVGTAAIHVHPVANQLIRDYRERFPLVEVELHPGFGPSQVDLLRRRALDASFVNAPLEDGARLRYLALGALEVRVAVPEGHRLAALDRIPRTELLKERYVAMPRAVDPSLVDHVRAQVFGRAEIPNPVEVADATLETRLRMVAAGEGFTVTVRPEEADLPILGVAFRHIDGRTPSVEYGLAWLDSAASSFVSTFVEAAERIVAAGSRDAAARRRGAKEQAS
jgi:DNA-binding transcriptional LysR family regulator